MKKAIIFMLLILSLVTSVMAGTLSVTKPEYITFQNELLKPAWKVTTQGDGASDYIAFGSAEAVEGTVNGQPAHARYDFTLKSSIIEETCNYALAYDSSSRPIEKSRMEFYPGINIWDVNKKLEECKNKGAELWYSLYQNLYQRQVYCWYETKEANMGIINSPKLNFRSKFELLREGMTSPIVKEVASLGASKSSDLPSSVFFEQNGQNVALVKWSGFGTFSGEFCPVFSGDYAAVETTGTTGNKWYLIHKSPYTEYLISARAYEEKFDDAWNTVWEKDTAAVTKAQHDALVIASDRLNRDAATALQETRVQYNSIYSMISGNSFSIDLQRKLMYAPIFDIFVWADFLQVVYESGDPQISGIRFNDCSESGSGSNYVEVNVYNQGEGVSEVISSISCSANIKLDLTSNKITLKPGDSGTLKFPFTYGALTDTTQSCSVTVYDAVFPVKKQTKSASTMCKATYVCSANDPIQCSGTTTYVCVNNQWVPKPDRYDCAKEICDDKVDNNGNGLIDEGCGGGEECKGVVCIKDNQCLYPETKKCCPTECGDPCNYNGEPEPLLGETLENCRPDFLTCNYDKVCDANEGVPGKDSKVCVDCDEAPDYNWVWIVGGIVAAGGIAVMLFKYMPKKKRR